MQLLPVIKFRWAQDFDQETIFFLPGNLIEDKPSNIPNDANLFFSSKKEIILNSIYLISQDNVLKLSKIETICCIVQNSISTSILGKLKAIETNMV